MNDDTESSDLHSREYPIREEIPCPEADFMEAARSSPEIETLDEIKFATI
jgi:hypothetical protein